MDLSAIYSKTPKGLRARASLIGGLSSHLMKVLTHVDGSSKAETILLKFEKLTPQQLTADLALLEQDGYIRLATVSAAPNDGWALTANFEPMVVEEFQGEDELEAIARAKKNTASARTASAGKSRKATPRTRAPSTGNRQPRGRGDSKGQSRARIERKSPTRDCQCVAQCGRR